MWSHLFKKEEVKEKPVEVYDPDKTPSIHSENDQEDNDSEATPRMDSEEDIKEEEK